MAAWRGFATAAECNSIQAFSNKVKRRGIISDDINIDDILDGIDYGLLKKFRFPTIVCIVFFQMSAVVYMIWKCVREAIIIICLS